MSTDDRTSPPPDSNDADLGPEPDWLTDDVVEPAPEARKSAPSFSERPAEPEPASAILKRNQQRQQEQAQQQQTEPIEVQAVPLAATPVVPRREHPWLWAAIPGLFLVVTVLIGWFATSQTLNDTTTWSALRADNAPLLPARWSLMAWWAVATALAVFIAYAATPGGRPITRIKLTGPLLTLALIGVSVWMFAQHWNWHTTAIISMATGWIALIIAYLSVALSARLTRLWHRILAVLPLSLAVAFTTMLTVITWQTYSDQPFGARGTSVLLLLIIVVVAAVVAFFLHDGAFSMVLTLWFLGVAQRQWGDDTMISLSAIVSVIFAVALAAMGTILAVESHKPSLTNPLPNRRSRIQFWKRSDTQTQERLPE